jgi:uncharacterized protein YicC (UPF0701 family)
MHPELDRLLDPTFIDGLESLDLDEVRARRAACQQREESVSYLRRVIQVRLDLLGTELTHRRSGEGPADAQELVARLPDVLAEHGRSPGFGQAPRDLKLPDIDDDLLRLVDQIVPPGQLADLGELDGEQLAGLVEQLEALEREVSDVRRQLHGHIDRLQAEITRRYKSGEASVDSLLQ